MMMIIKTKIDLIALWHILDSFEKFQRAMPFILLPNIGVIDCLLIEQNCTRNGFILG